MRPSGKLHLGHLHGVLHNWLELQKDYDSFFFVADWHALTSEYENTSVIAGSVHDMVIDWLSAGIDPVESTIFVQSQVPEHAELFVLLSMITPLPWLERNPTYKEQLTEIKDKDIRTYGFLGYPVLQTADIIVYKADKVPVGIDQAPHVELSREIVRRFNNIYCKNNGEEGGGIFPEPETLLTESKKFLGTDGRKMSKSYNNSIYMSDDNATIEKKLKTFMTDTARQRKTDPGDPEKCPFFESFHKNYSSEETLVEVMAGCKNASFGCIECKMKVVPKVLEELAPIQAKREELQKDKNYISDILNDGNKKAGVIARATMEEVREAMGLSYK